MIMIKMMLRGSNDLLHLSVDVNELTTATKYFAIHRWHID